jgi:hypothetical protein
MTEIGSVEDLIAVLETAEQRLAVGEAKARQAKTLLLEAENAREEAKTRKTAAEQRLASIEEALEKACSLQGLVGEKVASQGEALLEATWAAAQKEVTRLQNEAKTIQAEAEKLMEEPEVRVFFDHRQGQRRAEDRARRNGKQMQGADRRAGRREWHSEKDRECSSAVAADNDGAGCQERPQGAQDNAQAGPPRERRRVEAASPRAKATSEVAERRRKRGLFRWAERRSQVAQPGDFVFILVFAGETLGRAVHLRPLLARSGRLRFQVVEAWQMNGEAPDEYSDLPARGRSWAWCEPPNGLPEGLGQAQSELVHQLCRNRVPGWRINQANARLAEKRICATSREGPESDRPHRSPKACPGDRGRNEEAEKRATAGAPAPEGKLGPSKRERRATSVREAQGEADPEPGDSGPCRKGEGDQAGGATAQGKVREVKQARSDIKPDSHPQAIVDGIEGLPERARRRLSAAGLTSRQMIQDVLAAGEDVFLGLSGIGPETLDIVRSWLATEAEGATEDVSNNDPGSGGLVAEKHPYASERLRRDAGYLTVAEGAAETSLEDATREEADPFQDLPAGVSNRLCRAGLDSAAAVTEAVSGGAASFLARPGIDQETLGVVQEWLTKMLAAGRVAVPLGSLRQQDGKDGSHIEESDPQLTVVGDGLSGRQLSEWRGAARVGLASLARQLWEIQLLVCREGDELSVVACWPQGELTISDLSSNGRSAQMRAIRRIAGEIRATL